ncbi:MAG: SNF2-related protein [Deltaproteobacteria bacterium]|nr:SNF2-related protein [Deltaproteobacteria bacterium]
MLFRAPEDIYRDYNRFLRKGNYKRAYRCLESLLHEFPDHEELMVEIVHLCVFEWGKPEKARPWLIKLTKMRTLWIDYMLLSRVEAEAGNISHAKQYLDQAKELQKKQGSIKAKEEAKHILSEVEYLIKYKEWNLLSEKMAEDKAKATSPRREEIRSREVSTSEIPAPDSPSQALTVQNHKKEPDAKLETKEGSPPVPRYSIPVTFSPPDEGILRSFQSVSFSTLKEVQLWLDYTYLTIQGGFDELLCLAAITDVDKYWYQIETVKKVLKHFHGRVLLCDEVGLGKTIEAGMIIKEYLMRGMARNVLILTPPSLVSQWKEEMEVKFGIEFLTTDDTKFMKDPEGFWSNRYIIASLHIAKNRKNLPLVAGHFYDILVVDEAHHLRNRTTLAWKLVNQINKKFILLLSATPVQNNLIELFNLITLLKPGQFKTEKLFRQEYLRKGNLRTPAHKDKLRELLRDVMVRNTRSAIDLKLPRRFASTVRVEPDDVEREIYLRLNDYLRKSRFNKLIINLLLRMAGSSPFALKDSLLNMGDGGEIKKIKVLMDRLEDVAKGRTLVEILNKNPEEKKVIFTQYLKSMDYITDLLRRNRVPFVTFRGDMTTKDKNVAIESFRGGVPVLVSTESGGEGRNLQFCNTIINFDLPWNPMRIEQRIGRLHRIGQTRDVFIFNLSVRETIEDYIIDILDNKINMFELVIGEIEPILGHIREGEDLEDMIMEIWLNSRNDEEVKDGFESLGQELIKAKNEYMRAKALDDEIFGEDYEI